jgi:hypothetical protein
LSSADNAGSEPASVMATAAAVHNVVRKPILPGALAVS